jgi:hypothetical protein
MSGFSPPPPQPIDTGTLVQRAFGLYRAQPRLFLLLALVTALPIGLVTMGIDLGYGNDDTSTGRTLLAIGLQIVLAVLIAPISGAATTVATMDAVDGREPSAARALEIVGERFWPLVLTLTVATLGVAVGFMALFLPGVYLLVVWLFAGQAAVIERRPLRDSLLRSAELVRGGWWRCFATFLLVQVGAGLVSSLLVAPVARAADDLSYSSEVISVGLWRIVITTVVQPFVLIAIALLYLDRRVRQEGHWPEAPVPHGASG